jgi:hypothetical protein
MMVFHPTELVATAMPGDPDRTAVKALAIGFGEMPP